MFRFAHPEYLYLFTLLPTLILLFVYSQWQKRRRESRWGNRATLLALVPLRSAVRPVVKIILLLAAIACAVLMLAQPQYGISTGKVKRGGAEVIFALDVSQSMLARDVTPSRLERSKLLISTLTERMENDKIGLDVFAGEAYPILPITNDFVSANFFLDNVNTGMVTLQGTNIGAAIRLAQKGFSDNKEVGKAIVVITDGENHEGDALEAAKEAAGKGQKVFVLGVGSTAGAEIPTPNGPLRDREGKEVHTALNETACQQLAKAGHGIYIHLDGSNIAQDRLQQQLNLLRKSASTVDFDGSPNELFSIAAACFLVLLVVEMFVSEKQNQWFDRLHLFRRKDNNL